MHVQCLEARCPARSTPWPLPLDAERPALPGLAAVLQSEGCLRRQQRQLLLVLLLLLLWVQVEVEG